MCSLRRLPVAKNHNFGQILTLGAPVPTPFYRWGPNVVCYSRPMVYAYVPNFVSMGLFCRPVGEKKNNFCCFFGLQHLVLSPIGNCLTKLTTSAQLQTFPYPKASKSFLYSNAFMAKSVAQSLTFKSVTDRQKTQRFWPPRRVKSEPHQIWHGDRGPRARSCTSKTFGGLRHSFASRGCWKFGGNRTPSTQNPHNPLSKSNEILTANASWNAIQTLQILWKSHKGYAPLGRLYSTFWSNLSKNFSFGVLYPYRCSDGGEIWHGGGDPRRRRGPYVPSSVANLDR